MTTLAAALPYLVALWLLLVGLYGMSTSRNLIHLVACLSVFQTSSWLLLVAIGFRRGATAPILDDVSASTAVADPTVQALAVTGIVVGGSVLAVLLAFAVQIHKRLGTLDPDEIRAIRG